MYIRWVFINFKTYSHKKMNCLDFLLKYFEINVNYDKIVFIE